MKKLRIRKMIEWTMIMRKGLKRKMMGWKMIMRKGVRRRKMMGGGGRRSGGWR